MKTHPVIRFSDAAREMAERGRAFNIVDESTPPAGEGHCLVVVAKLGRGMKIPRTAILQALELGRRRGLWEFTLEDGVARVERRR